MSFGISPGGYVGFFDPQKNDMDTYSIKGDTVAKKRMEVKKKAEGARRALRYQRYTSKLPQVQLSRQEQWTRKMTSSSRTARSHRHQ